MSEPVFHPRSRMPYADYRALPDSVRAEWVDGEVVMTPSPSYRHQQAARRLANILERALSELYVVEAVTVVLPSSRERIPDVVAVTREPEGSRIHETPVLVVEVLSPGSWSEDTARKSPEYLAAGVQQFWVVDPENRWIDVLERQGSQWQVAARVDDDAPDAGVRVPGGGTVQLSLTEVLGTPGSDMSHRVARPDVGP